jgi:hypothetical protein
MYAEPDLGARDVADADDRAAVLRRAQDDVQVLLRIGVLRLRDHRERELDLAGVGLLADLTRAEELVLLADRVGDVRRRDAERGHPVRVHPDPHRLVRDAHDLRLAGAVDALQRIEHVDVGVVGDVVRAVAVVFRVDRDQHHDRRRLLLDVDALLDDGRRQLRHREVDAVLHLHLRDVGVGVEREVDGHRQLTRRRADRRHVEHVVDAVDLLLDRRGDRIRERLRVGARVGRGDRHLHRRDRRVLRHRQQHHRDGARERDDDRDDCGEDRPLDEEPGEHGRYALSAHDDVDAARLIVAAAAGDIDRRDELDSPRLDAQLRQLVAHCGRALLASSTFGRRIALLVGVAGDDDLGADPTYAAEAMRSVRCAPVSSVNCPVGK